MKSVLRTEHQLAPLTFEAASEVNANGVVFAAMSNLFGGDLTEFLAAMSVGAECDESRERMRASLPKMMTAAGLLTASLSKLQMAATVECKL